jgi:deazaflavin-dependent oxidoreductase (nitroreductase family)
MSAVLPPELAARPVCYLETTGRVTGRQRVIEIWFAASDDTIYLLAGGRDRAHWVRNVRREPQVRVRIAGRSYRGLAEVVEGSDEDGLARRLLATKYQGWSEGAPLSTWARESLPVRIRLVEGDDDPPATGSG